ncbi:MAG: CotH kinase family protein [Caldilineaceae bacterium]|nr:CotH kinase family protein [Caldilineaceae bacterium]
MSRPIPKPRFFLTLGVGLLFTLGTVALLQSRPTAAADSQAATTPIPTSPQQATDEEGRPAGWTTESHSNDVDPNYAVVFPDDKVNVITLTISAANWEAMQADMTELFGEPGTRRQGGPMGQGFGGPRTALTMTMGMTMTQPLSPLAPPTGETADNNNSSPIRSHTNMTTTQPTSPLAPRADFAMGGNGRSPGGGQMGEGAGLGRPGFGGGDFTTENPIWVTATLSFAGNTWTDIGLRYKGNSSLRGGWESQSLKLPFKLDFDEFEDEYPTIKNQRFYGFKQLSLANGFGDATYMRDALTYELLDEAGLVAAETAFYNIILDYGEGPVDLGIYTAIEVIDDTVIANHFGDDQGNIYEGDGRGVTLAEGTTLEQIEESFQKENNEDAADWSDIEALYTVLHAEERTTDPETWRADLAAIFDVDTFLEWLALSATLQHWDTYGAMTHNFYLYHDPETDQLVWISWDHNFVLGASPNEQTTGQMGGGPNMGMPNNAEMPDPNNTANTNRGPGNMRGGPGGRSTSLDKADVDASWPLIRYLLDDPIYYAQYVAKLTNISAELFDVDTLAEQYEQWESLLAPYMGDKEAVATFETAVQELLDRTYQRADEVKLFLEKNQE